MTDHRGIPTRYRGVNFRSRLEAKYAALFDLLGWKWSYEPIDLAGWIPDFAIEGKPVPILVEVKPIFEFDPALGGRIVKAVGHSKEECRWQRGEYETMICGAVLPKACWGDISPGWLWEGGWSPVHVFELNGSHGLCPDCDYTDRISGIYDGDGHIGASPDLEAMWIEAGNRVQWKAVAPRNARSVEQKVNVQEIFSALYGGSEGWAAFLKKCRGSAES
jgi:hypothetical protein